MSEEPAPHWLSHPAPYWNPAVLKAWIAAAVRLDNSGDLERVGCVEEGDAFGTEAEALLASKATEDADAVRNERRRSFPIARRASQGGHSGGATKTASVVNAHPLTATGAQGAFYGGDSLTTE